MSKMDYILRQASKITPEQAAKAGAFTFNYSTKPVYRVGVEAGLGAATGVGGAMLDKENDNIETLTKKALVGAGLGYAATEGLVMGSTQYLRSQRFSKLATDALTTKIPDLQPHKVTVGKLVNQGMQKAVKPVGAKYAIGGAGLAAGLVYSMMTSKEEGALGTSENMLAGGGLALMGAEVYKHLGKKDIQKTPFSKALNLDSLKKTETAKLLQSSISEVLDTKEGKELIKQVGSIFDSKEGRTLISFYDNLTKGNWKTAGKDISGLQSAVNKVQQSIAEYVQTDGGKQVSSVVEGVVKSKSKTFQAELTGALGNDLHNLAQEHFDKNLVKIQSHFPAAKEAFIKHEGEITKALEKVLPEEMKGNASAISKGLPDVIDKLDARAAQEVVRQEQKHENNPIKEESKLHAEKQAEDVAKQTEKNSKVTQGDLSNEEIKAKQSAEDFKQAKMKKMNNWRNKAGIAGAIGLGAFALASVMDTSQKLENDSKTSRMVEEQERNLTRKMNKQRQNQQQQAYGNIDAGQMVMDMWNERLGHHKMGNAKFQ